MADVPHIIVFLQIDDGSVREHENSRSSFCQCIICTKNANNAKQRISHEILREQNWAIKRKGSKVENKTENGYLMTEAFVKK